MNKFWQSGQAHGAKETPSDAPLRFFSSIVDGRRVGQAGSHAAAATLCRLRAEAFAVGEEFFLRSEIYSGHRLLLLDIEHAGN